MIGKLYLVATPIGNLEDITLRAIRILKEVDIIAAEDTRHTLKLLNHLEISKPLISYHRHNEEIKSNSLIEKIKEGKNIALVSDAGTPAISDPGEEIVKRALENNIEIIPIPGACALINALICSGFSTNSFKFLGFLPLNKKLRKIKFEEIQKENSSVILYEAPHKIIGTLKEMNNYIGERKIAIAREITKIHEEHIQGTVDEILNKINEPKGEYVIIIQDKPNDKNIDDNYLNELNIEEHYNYYINKGFDKKDSIKMVAKDRKLPKNDIYKEFINL